MIECPYRNTLWPSLRRSGFALRNSHTLLSAGCAAVLKASRGAVLSSIPPPRFARLWRFHQWNELA
jgi:hypothetical protein